MANMKAKNIMIPLANADKFQVSSFIYVKTFLSKVNDNIYINVQNCMQEF
jgi:hypothetical protein